MPPESISAFTGWNWKAFGKMEESGFSTFRSCLPLPSKMYTAFPLRSQMMMVPS